MKKLLMLMGMIALPLAFTSCGSDDNPPAPSGKDLTTPIYQSASETYFNISKTDDGNSEALRDLADELVFKFGEDGKAWVFSLNKKVVEGAVPCTTPKQRAFGVNQHEGEQWYVFVTSYSKNGNAYAISGVGTLSVTADSNNNAQGKLKVGARPETAFNAKKVANPIKADATSNQMARSWKIIQTRIEVSEGDLKETYGKVFKGDKAGDLTFIATDIDNPDNGIKSNMTKYLKDNHRWTSIKEVVLSHTGYLTILYANGKNDIATIRNLVLNQPISLHWSSEDLFNEYLSGDRGVSAKLQNNYLVLTFNSNVTANNVSKPYKVKVEFILEWAGR